MNNNEIGPLKITIIPSKEQGKKGDKRPGQEIPGHIIPTPEIGEVPGQKPGTWQAREASKPVAGFVKQ